MIPRKAIGALVISAAGLAGVAAWEGYRSEAYLDVVGVPTIGYGTTEGVELGDKITEPVARERLKQDMSRFRSSMQLCVKVPLHQYEFDAYASLTYNIGGKAFCGSTLVRKLNREDYAGACAEITRWNRAGGRVVQGLVNRRAEERARCEGRLE